MCWFCHYRDKVIACSCVDPLVELVIRGSFDHVLIKHIISMIWNFAWWKYNGRFAATQTSSSLIHNTKATRRKQRVYIGCCKIMFIILHGLIYHRETLYGIREYTMTPHWKNWGVKSILPGIYMWQHQHSALFIPHYYIVGEINTVSV